VIVFDANCNGVFGEAGSPGGHRVRGDRIWIGKGSAKVAEAYVEALPLGKYYLFEDQYYTIAFKGSNGNKQVEISKADVPLGTIQVNNPGFLFELVGGNSVFYVSSEKSNTVSVPVGKYRVNTASFRRRYKGKTWELEGRPGSCKESFTVKEGEVTIVEAGPPLRIMIDTDLRARGSSMWAYFGFSIQGSAGETYQYLRKGGKKIDLPEIVIRQPGNKLAEKRQFEYG
jgi:hypothetical protein